jgi:hypothetical protein|tara:strand:+ start:1234 stop:1539 length:306 start_codon:yes stop_codon:yes gene_type:complete
LSRQGILGTQEKPVKPIDTELQAAKAAWQSAADHHLPRRVISPCWSFLTRPDSRFDMLTATPPKILLFETLLRSFAVADHHRDTLRCRVDGAIIFDSSKIN